MIPYSSVFRCATYLVGRKEKDVISVTVHFGL